MRTFWRVACLAFICSAVASAQADIWLTFDEPPSVNQNAGTFISPASRLSNQYLASDGVIFSSGGGYVGVVNLGTTGTTPPNGISGSTSGNIVTYGQLNAISATFWLPGTNVATGTNFVSLRGDTDPTNGGWQVT